MDLVEYDSGVCICPKLDANMNTWSPLHFEWTLCLHAIIATESTTSHDSRAVSDWGKVRFVDGSSVQAKFVQAIARWQK